MPEDWPNLNRNTRAAKRKRLKLIEQLGEVCVDCGESDTGELEFDHINGRDWTPNKFSFRQRSNIYEREIREGKIELRCGGCNRARRETNDNGAFVPTGTNTMKTGDICF